VDKFDMIIEMFFAGNINLDQAVELADCSYYHVKAVWIITGIFPTTPVDALRDVLTIYV